MLVAGPDFQAAIGRGDGTDDDAQAVAHRATGWHSPELRGCERTVEAEQIGDVFKRYAGAVILNEEAIAALIELPEFNPCPSVEGVIGQFLQHQSPHLTDCHACDLRQGADGTERYPVLPTKLKIGDFWNGR